MKVFFAVFLSTLIFKQKQLQTLGLARVVNLEKTFKARPTRNFLLFLFADESREKNRQKTAEKRFIRFFLDHLI